MWLLVQVSRPPALDCLPARQQLKTISGCEVMFAVLQQLSLTVTGPFRCSCSPNQELNFVIFFVNVVVNFILARRPMAECRLLRCASESVVGQLTVIFKIKIVCQRTITGVKAVCVMQAGVNFSEFDRQWWFLF